MQVIEVVFHNILPEGDRVFEVEDEGRVSLDLLDRLAKDAQARFDGGELLLLSEVRILLHLVVPNLPDQS